MPSWFIIDANIFLDAVRYEVGPSGLKRDPAYSIIAGYLANRFVWVYSEEILAEYTYQFHLLRRTAAQRGDKRLFDTKTYNATMLAIRQGPGLVIPTEAQLIAAYDTIMAPHRAAHLRDPDDGIYLAAADEAQQQEVMIQVVLGSNDSDLYTLRTYKGIPIVPSTALLARLNQDQ